MGCDLFRSVQLSERLAFLPPIRDKEMGSRQGKTNKQNSQQDLKNIPLMAEEMWKMLREGNRVCSEWPCSSNREISRWTNRGRGPTDVCGHPDAELAEGAEFFRRRKGRRIEIYLHALQVSIIRVRSAESLSWRWFIFSKTGFYFLLVSYKGLSCPDLLSLLSWPQTPQGPSFPEGLTGHQLRRNHKTVCHL